MAKLKISSLQHLARHWRSKPDGVKRSLVALAKNTPTFNYNPLFGAIRDMLVLGCSYDDIVKGIHRGVKRPDVRENLLGVLPLIRNYFVGVEPSFVQSVERRFYPLARDLLVPFDPPLIYGVGGQINFPWFSFWRSNPLNGEGLSLFVTLIEEMLLQDPDLEYAKFTILDFSAPGPKMPRELSVIDARDIPRVSEQRKSDMLAIFVEGYLMAQAELSRMAPPQSKDQRPGKDAGESHPDLFS